MAPLRNAFMLTCRALLVLLLSGMAWAQKLPGQSAAGYPKDLPGSWSGMMRLDDQTLPLEFELYERDGQPAGALVTGDERVPFSSVELRSEEVTFNLAPLGGRMHGKIERFKARDSTEMIPLLRGDYTLRDGKGGEKRFWVEAVHMAPVVQKDYSNEPADATELWGAWQYQLTAEGNVVEAGTLELTNGKAPRERAWARMIPTTPQRRSVLLRGVGSKLPQEPSEEQLKAWEKSGKQPTEADFKMVEGIAFSRFDGEQALSLSADAQSDGTLSGTFWMNGEKLSFRAKRPL